MGTSLLVAACSAPPTQPAEPTPKEACNPLLGPQECFLPYPSDHFRGPDGIEVRDEALLRNKDDDVVDPHTWRQIDGFSPMPLILGTLFSEVETSQLNGVLDAPIDGPTYIFDTTTGATVPHFVDAVGDQSGRHLLVLHPRVRLTQRTRYVVAFVGIMGPDGETTARPAPFAQLLGNSDPHLEGLVLPVLEGAGIDRAAVQLAWDFTTGSDDAITADMLTVRDIALEVNEPTVEILTVTEPESAVPDTIWREIAGRIEGPLVLEEDAPGSELTRGPSGSVVSNSNFQFGFHAVIPESVRTATEPARVIAYGHGFFGTRRAISQPYLAGLAERLGVVLIAIDLQGLAQGDSVPVGFTIASEPAKAALFTDRLHQTLANWIVTTRVIRDVLGTLPAFQHNNGSPIYNPDFISYLGISLGHVLGGTFAALNPHVDRIALNVGGGGLAHLMQRSKDFATWGILLDAAGVGEPWQQQKFIASLQRHFDRVDALTYAPFVSAPVLMQVGLGDSTVPNFASYLHARALGLGQTGPGIPVWGIDEIATPATSGLTLFDLGVDTSFYADPVPPQVETAAHEGVRRLDAAIEQLDAFIRPAGEVVHPCDGSCDPE